MAALQLRGVSGSVALAAATAKTALQIAAAANQRVKLMQYKIEFDGVTNSAVPVQVRILRQTTAGTFTNATNVPTIVDKGLTETPQTNYQTVATAEPTAGDVLDQFTIPAYNGTYVEMLTPGQEIIIQGGGRLGFELNAPAIVNVRVSFLIEE